MKLLRSFTVFCDSLLGSITKQPKLFLYSLYYKSELICIFYSVFKSANCYTVFVFSA